MISGQANQSPQDQHGRSFTAARIPRFSPGSVGPQIFSSDSINRLVDSANLFLALRVQWGPSNLVIITDSGVTLQFKGSQQLSSVSA